MKKIELLCEQNICPFKDKNFSSQNTLAGKGWDFEYSSSKQEFSMILDSENKIMYLDRVPIDNEMKRIYPNNYYSNSDKSSKFVEYFRNKLEQKKITKIFELIKRKKSLSILDLGSGDGRLLKLIEKFSKVEHSYTGIELLDKGAKNSISDNFEIVNENVETYTNENWTEKFDIIFMHQLIEHVRAPQDLLKKCHKWLTEDGLISIETPQYNGWDYKIFKNRYWGGYHFPRHFFIFNQDSLEKLAIENNFKVMEKQSILSPVFWITSIHNFFKDTKNFNFMTKFFKYNNILMLVIFTTIETLQLSLFNQSSNLRIILRKTKQ